MKRIALKARAYATEAELEAALRETVQGLGLEDEGAGVVKCQTCYGWFIVHPDELDADHPPVKKGRFWHVTACDECQA